MGASACCLSWKREDVCVLPTAQAAPETGNTSPGGCRSDAMAEGGLTPRPRPPRCIHGGSHSLGSLGAPVLPGRGVPRSGVGCAGAGTWWQLVSVALQQPRGQDPRQPPALLGPSPHLQLGICPLAGHAQSSPCYKYPGAGLPALRGGGGCC